jgi:chemotaxis protein CheD
VAVERTNLPSCWHEFQHINRYWDKNTGLPTAKILPGEYYVTIHNEAIVTVLGSCVSACIRDPQVGIGGMNHFMLPETNDFEHNFELSRAARYGNFAMEQMINDILRNGGRKDNLEVKIFGGAKVMRGNTDIGARNIDFVRHYLNLEGLSIKAEDVGGVFPRKLIYFPKTGKVKLKKLTQLHNRTLENRELQYQKKIRTESVGGDVELFD